VQDSMIIWVANMDADRTRSKGRKIAKGLAIKSPDIKELSKAAHNLNIKCEKEKEKHFPGDSARMTAPLDGRLIISKKYSKTKTLKLLADEIRRIRKDKSSK